MTRTDDDSWDLASSVGATATMVAAARAVATKAADPLINDPFAEPLVRAVGVDFFTRLVNGEVNLVDADNHGLWGMARMNEGMAVRTRYFDEFFEDAGTAGIRQAVILASGLDSRAYRLAWPAGMTVYEIDQPQVIEFKSATLAALGAVPTTHRRAVGIDLRQDWPTALLQAGFDTSQPTAWIAEGLLGYLPPDAQDRLLDNLTALSVPGSRFATESVPNLGQFDEDKIQERMQTLTQSWREHGFDIDMAELVYFGDRNEAARYLDAHGWKTVASSTAELFAANGLPPSPMVTTTSRPNSPTSPMSPRLERVHMTRTDNDNWDITESVGATALGVAAARAAETESDNPLIVDPFAKLFLNAAGEGMWSMFSGGTLPKELADLDADLPARMQAMLDYMASRTVFFDEFFLTATHAGVRQAVILAAGLDARAWRLPWPDGTTVYELDQPKVLAFKESTLQANGAHPTARHVNVAVDLRQDWPKALRAAGFDASAPTAWSAEGLLPFLPAAAQDLLFDRVQELSAPGSRIAVEAFGSGVLDPDSLARQRAQMDKYRAAAAAHGMAEIPDVVDLWYLEDRADVADWLRGRGWDVSVASAHELVARNHRSAPEDLEDATPLSQFVSAQRSQP